MSMKCRPHGEPPGVPCIRPPVPPEPERLRLPVMTVNGAGPDENGDVKVDLSGIGALGAKVDSLGEAVSEETKRAVGAEEALGGSVSAETARAKAAEQGLRADVSKAQSDIADRYTKSETDEKIAAAAPGDYDAVKGRVASLEAKVPAQASEKNQLADKAFVNSSITTNTAFYISDGGKPFRSLSDLEVYEGDLTNNDYAFVVGRDAAGNTTYTRYKWSAATETWAEEYVLNNSSFTEEQWEAISSGITSGLVAKIGELPTAEALAAALANKADKATTLAGYGITDAATKKEVALKADKTAVDLKADKTDLAAKADKATTLAGYGITDAAEKSALASKADLVDGKVPVSQLPSYVSDVLEFASRSAFPAAGEAAKIYVAKDTNLTYRWSGTGYVEISQSLAVGETSGTAYDGAKGKALADVVDTLRGDVSAHAARSDNPHGVTAAQVGALAAVSAPGFGDKKIVSDLTEFSNGIMLTGLGNLQFTGGEYASIQDMAAAKADKTALDALAAKVDAANASLEEVA